MAADRLLMLVKDGHAEIQQYLVDGGLVLGDQPVQLSLPILIGWSDAHGDVVNEMRPAGVLEKQRHMQRRICAGGIISCDWSHSTPASMSPEARSFIMVT